MSLDYKQAGVDIEAGDQLVEWLKNNQPGVQPHRDRIVGGLGGFSALFRAGFPEMKSPCLVSSTDGIGTKLLLAIQYKKFDSVAQDLVAMCVNDLICCGAMPLFFLDYYASGKLNLEDAKQFLGGIQTACVEAQCALIGGETAEMPGVYKPGDFDAAGFSVGVVDEEKALGGHKVRSGDKIVAVESSGFHSNGYSLLRKVFEQDMDDWKDELLKPTHLYVALVNSLLAQFELHAVANVTGGGLDNLLRVTPKGCDLELNSWEIPQGFLEVQKRAELSRDSLLRTLNCGVGMAFFVRPEDEEKVLSQIKSQGFKAWSIGQVNAFEENRDSKWFFNGEFR